MEAVDQLAPTVGTASACRALGVSRATWYRHRQAPEDAVSPTPAEGSLAFREPEPVQQASEPARTSPRALSPAERQTVRDVLHSDRYVDQSPTEVYASLLDEGTYYCSARTMYRILEAEHETRERRNQARRPHYARPELLASGPNQLWSWDITKLLGPSKWTYYYLYVIIDVYSRCVVGWMLAYKESAVLAEKLIADTCRKQRIETGQLTIHADRGLSLIHI